MKVVVVFDFVEGLVWVDFIDLQFVFGQMFIDVCVVVISYVVKVWVFGCYYSFDGNLFFVFGIDGVGIIFQGQCVYFVFFIVFFGSMVQWVLVVLQNCLLLLDVFDDIQVVVMVNFGMFVWVLLVICVQFQVGEMVLINGVIGSVGQLVVQIVCYLGVKKIIVIGCNVQLLVVLDVDECIQLIVDDKNLSG